MHAPTLLTLSLLATALRSQCGLQLASIDNGLPGVDGNVMAMTWWDPDGPGPLPQRLVVGGTFTIAGTALAAHIAAFDPATGAWEALGSGLPGPVRSLGQRQNGRLLATANYDTITEWDGQTWQQLGGVFNGVLTSVIELPNGDLVAGGHFSAVAGQSAIGIARWNGTTWSPLGTPTTPFSNGGIDALELLPNGDLVIGGFFTQVSGVAANFIAGFDGTNWYPLGAGSTFSVAALARRPSGDLVARGSFAVPGGSVPVATWNGSQWQDLGPGTPSAVNAMTVAPNGDVVVFSGSGFWTSSGSGWSPFATWSGSNDVTAMAAHTNGTLHVGGTFSQAGGTTALGLATWDGGQWLAMASGTDQPLRTLAAGPGGTFAAGGNFTTIEGTPAQHLAYFDGSTWQAAGSGALGPVVDVALRPNGELLAIAEWTGAGSLAIEVRSWQGGAWNPVGPPGTWSTYFPYTIAPARNGDAWIAYGLSFLGALGIARWDGAALTMQSLGVVASVQAILELPNGDLALAGIFNLPTGTTYLVRWDGTSLQPFGTGTNSYVRAIGVLRNGDLVAVGHFTQPGNHVARWDGTAWHALGTGLAGFPSSLVVLPNDDLLVNEVIGSSPATTTRIMRWDGSQWTPVVQLTGTADSLALSDNGALAISGDNKTVAGTVSAFVARLLPTCPAIVANAGAGCSGSGGPVELSVDEPAWLGGELRTTTTGFAAGTLAVSIYGFAAQLLPMPSVHPLGKPGCWLYSDDDLLLQFTAVNGELSSQLPVPNVASLVGATLYHQVVPVEVDANGDITALVSSNAVVLVIGAL